MTATIIILDRKPYGGIDNAVFLDLIDILPALPPKSHGLSWAIFDLRMNYDEDDPGRFDDISTRSELDSGFQMTWDELWAFAKLGEQVIEGQFVGYHPDRESPNVPDRNPPEDTKFNEICAAYEIVLEAMDSSLWKICSKDTAMIEDISRKFQNVEGPS